MPELPEDARTPIVADRHELPEVAPSASRGAVLLCGELSRGAALLDVALALLVVTFTFWVLDPRITGLWREPVNPATPQLVARTVELGIFILLALGLLRLDGLPPTSFGVRRTDISAQVVTGACVFPLAYLAMPAWLGLWLAFHSFLPSLFSFAGKQTFLTYVRDAWPTGSTLAFVAVGAISEELLFRGIVLTRLGRAFRRWWLAVVVSSVPFGVLHMFGGSAHVLLAFLFGLIWGAVFWRTGSLITVTVAHFLFNCTQLLLPRLVPLDF